jgi:hypothetical protein
MSEQPTLRAQAVQAAAQAADAHTAQPDSVTLHNLQLTVQAALNLGAAPDDIRQARAQ